MVEGEIIGGAAYPKNSLAKAYANPEANKYTVEFKDGTVLVFPEQPYEREAEAKVTLEGRIDFYGFADADALGSAGRECVGGSLCKVNIRVCFQCGNPFDFTGFQSGILTQSL